VSQKNIAHSIFQRLLNRAKANKEDFNLLLSRYVFTAVFYEDHQKLAQWHGFIKKSKPDTPVGDLSAVIAEISEFIMPVINSRQSDVPFAGVWLPDQGWNGSDLLY